MDEMKPCGVGWNFESRCINTRVNDEIAAVSLLNFKAFAITKRTSFLSC